MKAPTAPHREAPVEVSQQAERVFADWLARREGGEAERFDELRGAHAELAGELAVLEERSRELERWLGELAADSRAWKEALESLGPAADEALAPAVREMVERLRRYGPERSRFALRRVIERGGMGVVLEVRDELLGRAQAMKVLRAPEGAAAPGASATRRFLSEAELLARLAHPSIVAVHDLGVDFAGRPFFTMPLVRGVSLLEGIERSRAGDSRWPLGRVVGALVKVCEALAYAHAQGVLHRDVKPENVMVGEFGEVYLMDWGLARVRGAREFASSGVSDGDAALTQAGDVLGTPAYMAPEQAAASGEVEIDARADVYGVGATLYHLIAGHAPYRVAGQPNSSREVLERLRRGPPAELEVAPPLAPAELVAIARRAMQRERDQRYRDAQQLAGDLRAYLEGRVVRAHESGVWPELRKWVLRNRALASAIAIAAISAAFGGSLYVASEQRRTDDALLRADADRLVALEIEADELWPATAANAERMDSWLRDAREVLQRLPERSAELAELERRGTAVLDASAEQRAAALQAELRKQRERLDGAQRDITNIEQRGIGPGREQGLRYHRARVVRAQREIDQLERRQTRVASYRFESLRDSDRHESLRRLVETAQRVVGPEALYGEMEARAVAAHTLAARSIAAYAREWEQACASIADTSDCPAYRGLQINPQIGLAPLGRDPVSGLWEFAHLESGEPPSRNANLVLELREDSAIVLVLIPGGEQVVTQYDVPGGERVAQLDPYFIGKHELTQAQWLRISGTNPSYHAAGNLWVDTNGSVAAPTLLTPVEQVSWSVADALLRRVGLILPTGAQWERAYRAGTDTPWYTGPTEASTAGLMNGNQGPGQVLCEDGWFIAAPIGSFPPNAFGIHDIAGNVAEWTRDWFWVQPPDALEPGDGLDPRGDSGLRAARGGNFWSETFKLHASGRSDQNPNATEPGIGVRVARQLDR